MDACFHAYVQWTLVLRTPCYYGYGRPAIVENSQPPGKTHKEMIAINSYYYGCSLILSYPAITDSCYKGH